MRAAASREDKGCRADKGCTEGCGIKGCREDEGCGMQGG